MPPPRPPGSARSVRPVRKSLKSFVRQVVRLVESCEQIIRMVVCKRLKMHTSKIRPVFLRPPPIPPYACARGKTAPHAERTCQPRAKLRGVG
jgi:hypothetical protein